MQEHHLPVTRSARYFTLGDPGPALREVWVVLHGYGQLAARFLRHFEPLDDGTRLIAAPEGLSRFYLTESPAERRVGASWMTREDRLAEIDDYLRYLDAVYADVLRPFDRSRVKITALGFSQGTATVCRWAALGFARVDRLIVWGGEVPPDLDLAREPAAGRLPALSLSLVYGDRDELFTPKVIAATEARLREHGIPYALVPFAGGHEIDAATLRRLG
ncbi:MAG: alpha/beta hydrolase [Gemmatimonadales bacterium]